MALFSRKLRIDINRFSMRKTNNVLIYTSSVHEMKFENRIFWISLFVRIVRSRLSIFNTCNNLMLKEVVQKELSRSYVLIQTKNHYICMYTLYITLSHKLSDSYGRSFIYWWRILTIFNLLKHHWIQLGSPNDTANNNAHNIFGCKAWDFYTWTWIIYSH